MMTSFSEPQAEERDLDKICALLIEALEELNPSGNTIHADICRRAHIAIYGRQLRPNEIAVSPT